MPLEVFSNLGDFGILWSVCSSLVENTEVNKWGRINNAKTPQLEQLPSKAEREREREKYQIFHFYCLPWQNLCFQHGLMWQGIDVMTSWKIIFFTTTTIKKRNVQRMRAKLCTKTLWLICCLGCIPSSPPQNPDTF